MPDLRAPDAHWLWANEPCRAACPVHTDAGAYVTAIAEGRYRGRVPDRPWRPTRSRRSADGSARRRARRACRRGTVDAPIAIRALKRFVTEQFGVESFAASAVWHEAHGPVPSRDGPSVGIVGGGPAGLAAACDLRLAGHPVTVYEAQDRLGGMMVLGIPEYRLPRRSDHPRDRGDPRARRRGPDRDPGRRAGTARTPRSIGTRRCSSRSAPAAPATSTFPATTSTASCGRSSTCSTSTRAFTVDLGERVVVVGGGNVAFDAARTALRAAAGGGAAPEPVALGRQPRRTTPGAR